jgi:hypothetical protein
VDHTFDEAETVPDGKGLDRLEDFVSVDHGSLTLRGSLLRAAPPARRQDIFGGTWLTEAPSKGGADSERCAAGTGRGRWSVRRRVENYFVVYVILRSDTGHVPDSLAGLGVDG